MDDVILRQWVLVDFVLVQVAEHEAHAVLKRKHVDLTIERRGVRVHLRRVVTLLVGRRQPDPLPRGGVKTQIRVDRPARGMETVYRVDARVVLVDARHRKNRAVKRARDDKTRVMKKVRMKTGLLANVHEAPRRRCAVALQRGNGCVRRR